MVAVIAPLLELDMALVWTEALAESDPENVAEPLLVGAVAAGPGIFEVDGGGSALVEVDLELCDGTFRYADGLPPVWLLPVVGLAASVVTVRGGSDQSPRPTLLTARTLKS